MDLFTDYADRQDPESGQRLLGPQGLRDLLVSIGEKPGDAVLQRMFETADVDGSGSIDVEEFLDAADTFLGTTPARCVLVVGGPGTGKGMLCERLVRECGVSHVSCGDMLRDEVQQGTPIGASVDAIMKAGGLVPSETITTLLRRRMRAFGARRLLIDGFPRSRQNAIDFADQCGRPELALYLTCPEHVMVERILRRGRDSGRSDDNSDAAMARIATFRAQGAPTMAWLRETKVPIVELDTSGTPEEAWTQLLTVGRLMRSAVAIK